MRSRCVIWSQHQWAAARGPGGDVLHPDSLFLCS